MKHVSYVFAAIALVAVASGFLRWHSLSAQMTTGMPPLQELHRAAGVNKLPAQDFDDRSLVYPREVKP